jgi:hypothetical protein
VVEAVVVVVGVLVDRIYHRNTLPRKKSSRRRRRNMNLKKWVY